MVKLCVIQHVLPLSANIRVRFSFDFVSGGRTAERRWIVDQISKFSVCVEGKKKPEIHYRLPLVGKCCRAAWVQVAGFPNPRNSRVTSIEALVRDPSKRNPIHKKRNVPFETRTNYCKAFLANYIWLHSQQSPATSDL